MCCSKTYAYICIPIYTYKLYESPVLMPSVLQCVAVKRMHIYACPHIHINYMNHLCWCQGRSVQFLRHPGSHEIRLELVTVKKGWLIQTYTPFMRHPISHEIRLVWVAIEREWLIQTYTLFMRHTVAHEIRLVGVAMEKGRLIHTHTQFSRHAVSREVRFSCSSYTGCLRS